MSPARGVSSQSFFKAALFSSLKGCADACIEFLPSYPMYLRILMIPFSSPLESNAVLFDSLSCFWQVIQNPSLTMTLFFWNIRWHLFKYIIPTCSNHQLRVSYFALGQSSLITSASGISFSPRILEMLFKTLKLVIDSHPCLDMAAG